MHVDRRRFIASVGGAAAVAAMGHEDRAEALEHYMTDRLDSTVQLGGVAQSSTEPRIPRGTGNLFRPTTSGWEAMPAKPTLIDFFERRFAPDRASFGLRAAPAATVFTPSRPSVVMRRGEDRAQRSGGSRSSPSGPDLLESASSRGPGLRQGPFHGLSTEYTRNPLYISSQLCSDQ